jgi:hypothetical protein
MNVQELQTWTRLTALDLDAANAALPFSARLARDNAWSRDFAAGAIDEYRKFCFLAVHAGHPVTPSDEVDQVWHLHLLYSQHYWEALCRDTLELPLHHGPTKGGAAEGDKFNDWYEATRASYRRYFGEPPREFWPAARQRFDEGNDFVRINRREVATIDRALLKRGVFATLAGGAVLAVAHALAQADGSAEAPLGISFGVVLPIALLVVIVVAAARGGRRRPSQRRTHKRRARDGAATGGCGATGSSSSNKASGDGHDGGGEGGSSGCSGGGGCGGGD